jgi:sulfate adenylyltransferase
MAPVSTAPASLPQHHPSPRELDDLELLGHGALAPLTGFNEPGSPVTLALPAELADAPEVELVDPEGLPLATYVPATGAVTPLTHAQFGPFRPLHLSPAQAREQYAGRTVVPVTDALTEGELDELRRLGPLLLLALTGHDTPALSPVALVRATLAATELLPDAAVVVVPLAAHGDPTVDHELGARVAANYAGGDPVHGLVSRGLETDPEGALVDHRQGYPEAVAAIVDADQPAPEDQGLVLFFTGLSGSGKSTLARALMDRILEQGLRTVTSLDGDVVRRNLSKGLTFSKEDRETNIRRIGWVAAEISRHGGLAVCSPIAPFAQTRADVRRMVEEAGGAFFLVHVATPLEECERRDRKGLYAKARRGEIPEFTGISSPYEEPDDAAVRVDTTGRSIEDALDDVVGALAESGHLDLRPADPSGGDSATESVAQTVADAPPRGAGEGDRPLEVLFVCTANICRSAHMELTARRLAGSSDRIRFTSAGTHGLVDHPMDDVMAATLARDDVVESAAAAGPGETGVRDFRSRPLTPDLVRHADLVLTAESAHRAMILEEQPEELRKVFTLGHFAHAVEEADPALRGRDLIAAVATRRSAGRPEHDIADPYRRGDEAAGAAAGTISSMLSVIVPRLLEAP